MNRLLVCLGLAAALAFPQTRKNTWIGTITCTMCGANHKAMNISPDDKCVRECVRGHGSKYALLVGDKLHTLHDQRTPEKFAAQRVKVTGVLYEKTGILKFDTIEPVK